MSRRIGQALRVIAGLTLLVLSVEALRTHGFVRWLAGGEVVAAALFCLPRLWRIGGVGLLVVLGLAITHHALDGRFVGSLFFAALVVLMTLNYERP